MKLLVILTFPKSLSDWIHEGTFDREIKYYTELAKKTNMKITFFSYGDKDEKKLFKNNKYLSCISIDKKNNKKLFIFFYSVFFLCTNLNTFRDFNFIKTNQNYGSWIGAIIKILIPKLKFISRGGYDLFHFKSISGSLISKKISYIICLINYRFADVIFVPTNFYQNFVNKKFKIDKSKIRILPNYIDTNLFINKNISKYKNRILFIGRLIDQKNLFNLIKYFSNSKYQIDMIGKGILKNDLIKYANIVNSKIRILSPISNEQLPNHINKYQYFFLNSYYEGNPKVLLESMSSELLCIGNNVQGINNIIKNNYNGIIVNNDGNNINLFNSLASYKIIKSYGSNARKYVLKNHSLEVVIKREINVYKKI